MIFVHQMEDRTEYYPLGGIGNENVCRPPANMIMHRRSPRSMTRAFATTYMANKSNDFPGRRLNEIRDSAKIDSSLLFTNFVFTRC